jgi:hypothetical protein
MSSSPRQSEIPVEDLTRRPVENAMSVPINAMREQTKKQWKQNTTHQQ